MEMEDDFIDIVGINPEDENPLAPHALDVDGDIDVDSTEAHLSAAHDGDAEMAQAGQDEDTFMMEASGSNLDHHSSDPFAKSARAGPAHRKLRIDWLLLLDLKFWKLPRANLREVYIGTLVLSPKYKKFMGKPPNANTFVGRNSFCLFVRPKHPRA